MFTWRLIPNRCVRSSFEFNKRLETCGEETQHCNTELYVGAAYVDLSLRIFKLWANESVIKWQYYVRPLARISRKDKIRNIIIIIIIIIGIQPLGRSGQRPEFSQATGMALVRCILGKFLGVACHCFPPLFRCSHFSPPGASTFATTWEIPAAEVGTVGENVVR